MNVAIDFLIFLIVLVLLVAVVMWAVQHFLPAIHEPATYVVGTVALIVILYRLRPLLVGVFS